MYTKVKQAALEKLAFDVKKHRYTYSGAVVPSVTQVLDHIMPPFFAPADVLEAARVRGTLVHYLTEVFDAGDDWHTPAKDCDLYQYIRAWEAFKQENQVSILESEQKVFHSKILYAGTFDRLISAPHFWNGEATLLDIKTGHYMPEYALQTAAYVAAYNEGRTAKHHVKHRLIAVLGPTGSYTLFPLEDRELGADFQTFLAGLTLASWRLKHGKP